MDGRAENNVSSAEVKGLVVDEAGNPLQNALVDVWQVVTKRYRSTTSTLWTLETSIKTGVDGSFIVSVERGFDYRFYVYTEDLQYVPVVIPKYIGEGSIEGLNFQLFPSLH